jgi:alkanesulfonate monooxygenase SsuD/methylene tetrahydromethanopterin reductase-like flavin-dependent oxidoreductase (luciferase family)
MRFGLFVPAFHGLADPGRMAALATAAEAAGWDGVFVWDHMLAGPGTPLLDPWVTMTAMACSTQTLRLGAMVTPLSRRRPWVMARQAATLDLLSKGRLTLGIGLGDDGWSEFSAFGEVTDARERGLRLDESLEVLRMLLSGDSVSYHGDFYSVETEAFLPRPHQRPLPIWAAGRWPRRRPLERAATVEGFFPIFRQENPHLAPAQAELLAIQKELQARRVGPDYDLVVTRQAQWGSGVRHREADLDRLGEAGVTWLLEGIPPEPVDTEEIDRLVHLGPPRY